MSDTTTDTQPGIVAVIPSIETPAAPGLTQEQVNRILADEKRKWKTQAEQESKAAALAAQGEYRTLAEQQQARADALEATKTEQDARLAAYQVEVERQVKARVKSLPEEIRAMQPEGDALEVYRWLEKAEAAAAKLAPVTQSTGTPGGPRGGAQGTGNTTADLIAQKRASGGYGL